MLKIRFFLCLFLIVSVLGSCKKDKYDAEEQAKIDDVLIQEFIAKNSIVAVKHSSGIYYQIINPGAGTFNFTSSSTVFVNYSGRLLDGTQFDKSTTTAGFALANLIQGWQIGIPLIQKGGTIRLIIPSGLAYKNESPSSAIPKKSVLDFTIDLINAQ